MVESFKVIGRNFISKNSPQCEVKGPSRKLFNTKLSSAENYEHEIANHYRDYKHQVKNNRIRIRKSNFQIRKVLFEDYPVDRDILHINRIDFPESILTRSRRRNCGQPIFDNVCNNTLRRILAANTVNEFKILSNRQEQLFTDRKGLAPKRRTASNSANYLCAISKAACSVKREKRYSLGHIRSDRLKSTHFSHQLGANKQLSISGDNKANVNGVCAEECSKGEISDDKDNYFLHLASECYDEGFLAHIKYLESIGERNAINNQISKEREPGNIFEKDNSISRPQSVGSNVSSSNSVEERTTTTGIKGFILVVKRILRTRRFGQNPCNYDGNVHGATQHDWKIRVNITRSSSPESLHSNRSSIQDTQDNFGSNHCIMSDALNVNEEQPQQISASSGSSVKNQHFHDLIENLSNLEISELGSLPKIVLTDFSTSTSNPVPDSVSQLRAKPHENTIRKQQSLEVELPSLSDYSSEARPP